MKNQSVQALLEDIRLVSEQNYEIVKAVRALVQKTFETISEEVKCGGILFRSGVQFGGVFAYKTHVTVEFGKGAASGATELKEPETKPWGQVVSYVRCPDGTLVEVCSPVGG